MHTCAHRTTYSVIKDHLGDKVASGSWLPSCQCLLAFLSVRERSWLPCCASPCGEREAHRARSRVVKQLLVRSCGSQANNSQRTGAGQQLRECAWKQGPPVQPAMTEVLAETLIAIWEPRWAWEPTYNVPGLLTHRNHKWFFKQLHLGVICHMAVAKEQTHLCLVSMRRAFPPAHHLWEKPLPFSYSHDFLCW